MTHIHREKIAYRDSMRKVIGQGSNKYQIKYKKEIITLIVDPYIGSVARA